jgi:DNA-binding transcriptional regulator LsrR (DeoR family)
MAESKRASQDAIREQTVEIAKLYHEEGLAAPEIMARLPKRLRPTSTRTVYRRLAEAPKYVDVVVTPREAGLASSRVRIDDDLSARLSTELGIADAVVLAADTDEPRDDVIQKRMGWLAARYVASQIGDYDTIGVGSGRGVWSCVDALSDHKRLLNLRGLGVVSLSGAVARWGPLARMDADANADHLARLLELPSTAIRTTNLPLTMHQLAPEQRRSVIAQVAPQLSDDDWSQDAPPWDKPPGVEVVGLGVYGPGHWLVDLQEGSARGIEDELAELRLQGFNFASLVDICFNLIQIKNIDSDQLSADSLAKLFDRIKEQTFNVNIQKLNAARVRVLIAGGPAKRAGAVSVLADPSFPFRPTCVVTDDVTAQATLDYVRARR